MESITGIVRLYMRGLVGAVRAHVYERLAWWLPRELVAYAGMRILSEVTRREELSKVGREVHQGEIRLLHALDVFRNVRQ